MAETAELPHASSVLDARGEIKPEFSKAFNTGETPAPSEVAQVDFGAEKTARKDTLKQIEQITTQIRDAQLREAAEAPDETAGTASPVLENKKPGSRLNILAYTLRRLMGKK